MSAALRPIVLAQTGRLRRMLESARDEPAGFVALRQRPRYEAKPELTDEVEYMGPMAAERHRMSLTVRTEFFLTDLEVKTAEHRYATIHGREEAERRLMEKLYGDFLTMLRETIAFIECGQPDEARTLLREMIAEIYK